MKRNPAVQRTGASRQAVEAEADRILAAAALRRQREKRKELIQKLIQESPKIEVSP